MLGLIDYRNLCDYFKSINLSNYFGIVYRLQFAHCLKESIEWDWVRLNLQNWNIIDHNKQDWCPASKVANAFLIAIFQHRYCLQQTARIPLLQSTANKSKRHSVSSFGNKTKRSKTWIKANNAFYFWYQCWFRRKSGKQFLQVLNVILALNTQTYRGSEAQNTIWKGTSGDCWG